MKNEIINLPKPYPDPELYNSVLSSGFKQYPEREKNYRKYENHPRTKKLDYLPVKLDIENVSRCNYHCTMCSVSKWHKLTRARDMTLEEFRHLIDAQYGLIEIKIQGLGEPFLSTDFIPMVKYARERHIWVRSTTNASLLDRKENYKKIIDADISELQVSIDGGTKAVFEKIRKGSRFEKVVKNTTLLNEYSAKQNKSRTRAWSLIQKDNLSELEEIVVLCSNLGFNRLTFSLDVEDTAWEMGDKNHVNSIDVKNIFNTDKALDLIQLGEKNKIEVTFWMTFDKYKFDNPHTICPWPFQRAVISSDMRIVPCCIIANPDIYELGDANNFNKIWDSKVYENFRKSHIDGKLPNICKVCYVNDSCSNN